MVFNPEQIPSFYAWIKANFLAFVAITFLLLASAAIYEFMTGFLPAFGQTVATQHSDFRRAAASYSSLDIILQQILEQNHAQRVGLFRFHDDAGDVSRMSFFFASVANMVASPGVTVDMSDITNIPASTFAPVLPSLMEHHAIAKQSASLPPGALREMQLKRGTHYSEFVPVTDFQDGLVGFLQIDWMDDRDEPSPDAEAAMVGQLKDQASRIAGFFSLPSIPDHQTRKFGW